MSEVDVNAAAIISAVQTLAKINGQGKLVERSEQINLNEMFERMSQHELEIYARDGALPQWFTRAVGVTQTHSQVAESSE